MQALVKSITHEAEGVLSLELVDRFGGLLPPFTPGAHIDLQLTADLSRSYSLTNSPEDGRRYVVAVNNDPKSRGGSRYVHDVLRPGQVIDISAPRNHFPLVETAPHVVFIAGGIGVTPLWCMVQRLESLGRSWELHYCARSAARAAFLGPLQGMEQAMPGRVHLNFDDERAGVPINLGELVRRVRPDAHLYCCGPVPMLEAFEKATAARPPEQVHREYFSARNEAAVEGGFKVVLARSGRSFDVPPGQTILDTVLAAGVEVPYSCTQGICGACETRVLDGEPDHRDAVLSPEEITAGETMMICCSGSRSRTLVLDL